MTDEYTRAELHGLAEQTRIEAAAECAEEAADAQAAAAEAAEGRAEVLLGLRGPTGHDVAHAAAMQLGKPYVSNGQSPAGFDCSGLLSYALQKAANYALPSYTVDQFERGEHVGWRDLRQGEAVLFNTESGVYPGHVGIFDGYSGGHLRMIAAARPGEGVVRQQIDTPYWEPRFAGARRYVPAPPAAPSAPEL
jgi:cell wall-associated NlpC family hydrolase